MAEQGGGYGVPGTGVDQALETAGFGVVLGRGEGLEGEGEQRAIGQEAGCPADDGLVDPGPPGVVIEVQVTPVSQSNRWAPLGPRRWSSCTSRLVG